MKNSFSALLCAASLVLSACPAGLMGAAKPPDDRIDGTWTWEFTMPDGSSVNPKVTLKRNGEILTGTTSFRPGSDMKITNGVINGDEVSFEVVRERDGRKVVTKYSGRVTGGTISGRVESDWAGDLQTYDWLAIKPILPPNSAWKSVVALPDGTKQQWRMRFSQKKDSLEGRITTSSFQPLEIKNGKVQGEEISFIVDRKRGAETDHFEYRGTVRGDSITGKVLSVLKGETNTLDWTATRPPPVVDGRWTWTHGGAKRELTLKRDGEKLTGKFIVDEKHEYDIEHGTFTGGEVYFEVTRERDADKTLTKFSGALADDRIVGKTEFSVNDGAPQGEEWQAERVEAEGGPRGPGGPGGGQPRGRGRPPR
jgi:hypothetical protein